MGSTVTFAGTGGDLVLGNLSGFSAQIAGLTSPTQKIDLVSFAYSSTGETASWTGAANNTSGTLTVTDGGQVAKLNLKGYITSYFVLSTDNADRTFVVDPPVTGGGAAHFAQAMAALGAGTSPSAGGVIPLSSGGDLFSAAPLIPTTSASGH